VPAEENKDDKVSEINKKTIFEDSDSEARAMLAYILMLFFVICTSLGAALIYFPAGFITLGVTSGIYGYLLGSE
jgi:hypothetical protein